MEKQDELEVRQQEQERVQKVLWFSVLQKCHDSKVGNACAKFLKAHKEAT